MDGVGPARLAPAGPYATGTGSKNFAGGKTLPGERAYKLSRGEGHADRGQGQKV